MKTTTQDTVTVGELFKLAYPEMTLGSIVNHEQRVGAPGAFEKDWFPKMAEVFEQLPKEGVK